jgi:S1-C subfamily serine protease
MRTFRGKSAPDVDRPDCIFLSLADAQLCFRWLYRQESSGVLKIVASTCGGTGIGTGFLLSSGMIASVAHVVTGAVSVAVTGNGETSAATVVGYDASQDLTLLRPSKPFAGHAFAWAAQEPAVGDQVAAIGYPLRQPETLTTGTVSGLNRKIPVSGRFLSQAYLRSRACRRVQRTNAQYSMSLALAACTSSAGIKCRKITLT